MTIIRCPIQWMVSFRQTSARANTDHDARKQDCHVPAYVDSALAKVAANHPGLSSITRKFDAMSCPLKIDGTHLHGTERTGGRLYRGVQGHALTVGCEKSSLERKSLGLSPNRAALLSRMRTAFCVDYDVFVNVPNWHSLIRVQKRTGCGDRVRVIKRKKP